MTPPRTCIYVFHHGVCTDCSASISKEGSVQRRRPISPWNTGNVVKEEGQAKGSVLIRTEIIPNVWLSIHSLGIKEIIWSTS